MKKKQISPGGVTIIHCIPLAILLLLLMMCSCTSTKDVAKTEIKTVVDSSSVRKADSLALVINRMKVNHARELQEARRTSVVFKDTPCPEVNVEGCDEDSLKKLIQQQQVLIKSFQNKVTQLANGSIVYEGQIASATADLERLEMENTTLAHDNISLIQQREELTNSLKKTQEEVVKLKKTKTSFLNFWWVFVLGFIAGIVSYHKLKNKRL